MRERFECLVHGELMIMQKHHFLYWGYSFQDEHAFKDKREKRTEFIKALRQEGREAGLI